VAFYAVYAISENHRREEFFQRLKDRVFTTYKILIHVDQIDRNLLQTFDKNTINSLYDEKILLYDATGKEIYSSIDDLDIRHRPNNILEKLKGNEDEVALTEGAYEVLGTRFATGNQTYYGIAKAHDRFGKSKILLLRNSLLIIYSLIVLLLIILSLYLSKIITSPITRLTKEIQGITSDDFSLRINTTTNDEVGLLTNKFNELLERVKNALKFQQHFIHHVSHELKTPLSVMMSNVETALKEHELKQMTDSLQFQKNALMEISYIINAMMDISKVEHQLAGTELEDVRLDELLFECIDEIHLIDHEFRFDLKLDDNIDSSEMLTIKGNSRMLKMAIMNLLKNAINYSEKEVPNVELKHKNQSIYIDIVNDGGLLTEEEEVRLFTHLFRGENSRNIKGFGLGLVLTKRVIALHNGHIQYSKTADNKNCFTVSLPLSA
jgi:signal transduction histidine kinase